MNKLQLQENCHACAWRSQNFFCDFTGPALHEFQTLKITHSYARGATLFIEGQPAKGIYMLCAGKVKLSTYSEDGKAIIVHVAEPGEILGLSANISEANHEATAHAIDPCQVNYVKRSDFINFLRRSGEAAFGALRELSNVYQKAHLQVCSLGLSASVGDKLAKLFLGWYDRGANGGPGVHIPMSYTHEEIAEMIGTSRETVTRLLTDFRRRNLVVLKGSDMFIPDRGRLKGAINGRYRRKAGENGYSNGDGGHM